MAQKRLQEHVELEWIKDLRVVQFIKDNYTEKLTENLWKKKGIEWIPWLCARKFLVDKKQLQFHKSQ